MNTLARLKEIQNESLELEKQFFAIPDGQRNSRLADPIRARTRALQDESDKLVGVFKAEDLPRGFREGYPREAGWGFSFGRERTEKFRIPKERMYAVQVLPSDHAPVEVWGTVFPIETAEKELAKHGLEFHGSFLAPKGSHLAREACRRRFISGPVKDAKAFRQWYEVQPNKSNGHKTQQIATNLPANISEAPRSKIEAACKTRTVRRVARRTARKPRLSR